MTNRLLSSIVRWLKIQKSAWAFGKTWRRRKNYLIVLLMAIGFPPFTFLPLLCPFPPFTFAHLTAQFFSFILPPPSDAYHFSVFLLSPFSTLLRLTFAAFSSFMWDSFSCLSLASFSFSTCSYFSLSPFSLASLFFFSFSAHFCFSRSCRSLSSASACSCSAFAFAAISRRSCSSLSFWSVRFSRSRLRFRWAWQPTLLFFCRFAVQTVIHFFIVLRWLADRSATACGGYVGDSRKRLGVEVGFYVLVVLYKV